MINHYVNKTTGNVVTDREMKSDLWFYTLKK